MMTSESRRTPATAGGDGLGAYRGGAASRTRWWGRYRCGLAIDPRSHGVSRHARPRRRRRLAPGRREPTRRSYVPADAPGLEDDGGRTRRDRAAYGPYDVYTSLGRVRQRLALTDVQDGEAHLGEETRRRRQQPVSVFDSTGAAQEAAQAEIAGTSARSRSPAPSSISRRILVASTSNFSAAPARDDYPTGTILSIDSRGAATIELRPTFAAAGRQARTRDGWVIVYTAQTTHFFNSAYNPRHRGAAAGGPPDRDLDQQRVRPALVHQHARWPAGRWNALGRRPGWPPTAGCSEQDSRRCLPRHRHQSISTDDRRLDDVGRADRAPGTEMRRAG